MDQASIAKRDLTTAAWGALLVWWGVTELIPVLPNGTGLLGIGLILLGLNVARWRYGHPTSGFTITLGILALVWGGLDLAATLLALPFEIPVFAILLLVLGAVLLVRGLR
jgi:hypothetical protein